MDCNPVMVLARDAVIVDARVKVRIPAHEMLFGAQASR